MTIMKILALVNISLLYQKCKISQKLFANALKLLSACASFILHVSNVPGTNQSQWMTNELIKSDIILLYEYINNIFKKNVFCCQVSSSIETYT